ncbi:transposable element Tcb2 transposase [Trichonephila clavipes]|nr:transposable element Tcb2 transposase [Trichonephila clavipes]
MEGSNLIPYPYTKQQQGYRSRLKRMEASECWRAVGRIEAGQSFTDVALFFGAYHSVISRLWKHFQATQTVGGITGVTSPAEDRYIAIVAKRNRIQSMTDGRSETTPVNRLVVPLFGVSEETLLYRVSAEDKGCRFYPLDPRPVAAVLYSGCTPDCPLIVSPHKSLNSSRGVISESDLMYTSKTEILHEFSDTVPDTSNSLSTSTASSSSHKELSSSKVSMFTPLTSETCLDVETSTTISNTIPSAPQTAKQSSRNRRKKHSIRSIPLKLKYKPPHKPKISTPLQDTSDEDMLTYDVEEVKSPKKKRMNTTCVGKMVARRGLET